ncbi:gamma-butyrobetaine dioxygenase-like isoform X2 [Sycon ciliatum]|uniref:gamma-butyrobetaine dioxygenase-like isoform X2 n=1 Tax=Sycon ciliatum TaxID=27933 RepID=UPI0031F6FD6C
MSAIAMKVHRPCQLGLRQALPSCNTTPCPSVTQYHSVACSGVKQRLPTRPLSSVSGKCCSSVLWERTAASSANTATQPKLITSSSFDANERMISVQLGESPSSTVYTYPGIYLRDNCTCPTCLHTSGIRAREMVMWEPSVIDKMTSIKNVQSIDDDNAVQVEWGDDHVSIFSAEWLLSHRLSSEAEKQSQGNRFTLPERKHWEADRFPSDTSFTHSSLLKDQKRLLEFLRGFYSHGVAIVRESGTHKGPLEELANRIGFLRQTVYGTSWLARVQPNANTMTYASLELPMHVDMPYLSTPPGIVMLHCMSQAPDGGFTYCTDGFRIAHKLRRDEPETFRVLCEVPVTWSANGTDLESGMDYCLEGDQPVIELDRRGNLKAVRLNQVRSSWLHLDASRVPTFYAAMQTISRMACDARYRRPVRLEPGEMLFLDNHRLFHGRSELDAVGAAERCLHGGYMDWDVIISRMRQIHHAQGT